MANRALFSAITVAMLGFAVEAPAQQQQQPKQPERAGPSKTSQPKTDQVKADLFAKAYGARLCQDPLRCLVTVKVGAGCSFTVTPWTLGMLAGNRNVKIHWQIDPASAGNAEFALADGIFFKGPANEFDDPKRLSKTEFRWNDKNPSGPYPARPFAYGINVIQGGKPCPTLDPTIVNDF